MEAEDVEFESPNPTETCLSSAKDLYSYGMDVEAAVRGRSTYQVLDIASTDVSV